nr:hypothetical protein [Tanacetum cinerariifolium]
MKKANEKKRDVSRVKCYNCKKEDHFAKDCKKAKVKDYEYYKTNMLLAKKDKDEQVLLAEDQAWMESSSDSDKEINANMAQIEKVLSDLEASSSSADEKISELTKDVAESSIKNLIPIPNECMVVSENERGIDFDSEEIENFLNDDSIPFGVEDSPFNMDEDILFLESLLREDPIPPNLIIPNQTKLLIEEQSTHLIWENGSKSTEPVNDNSSVFTTISNPLFDNDKINSDEIDSHVESNYDESTSNHDTVKCDYLDEIYRPFIPIHILEEERIRREYDDYNNRMEMLFTINPRPHPTYANINVESSSSLPIQESKSRQEEINIIAITNNVLPPSVKNDDSVEEVDDVDVLRVDNYIQNSKYEYFESEDSDFDNSPVPLPPPEPPDEEFDFEINFENEISVVRNTIVKFECIDARVKFDVFNDENDDLSYFMFIIIDKEFSFLSAKSEDTIFDPGISD